MPSLSFETLKPPPFPQADYNGSEVRHGFQIGRYPMLVPLGAGSEVLSTAGICPIPNTPAWFGGFINHRGNIVPVFALAKLFGEESSTGSALHFLPQQTHRLLLLGSRQRPCALIIDAYPQTLGSLRCASADSDFPVPEALRAHISGIFVDDQRYWIDFCPQAFFASLPALF